MGRIIYCDLKYRIYITIRFCTCSGTNAARVLRNYVPLTSSGPFCQHRLSWIATWISNCINKKCRMKLLIHIYSKLQRHNRWRLAMEKYLHLTLYSAGDYLSTMGLKLNHVSKRGFKQDMSPFANDRAATLVQFHPLQWCHVGFMAFKITENLFVRSTRCLG